MRLIKFRVWNTRTNKWVHGPGNEVNLFGETILLGGFMNGIGVMELNDCIPLQYIGSKDKNGKEIYEGDIVHGYTTFQDVNDEIIKNEEFEFIGEVKYCGCSFICENSDFPLDVYNVLEIVGNIFENKL